MQFLRPEDGSVLQTLKSGLSGEGSGVGTDVAIGRSQGFQAEPESVAMSIQGLITTNDVLRHPVLIVGSFGVGAYWRCCKAILLRRRTTFLDCAWR